MCIYIHLCIHMYNYIRYNPHTHKHIHTAHAHNAHPQFAHTHMHRANVYNAHPQFAHTNVYIYTYLTPRCFR